MTCLSNIDGPPLAYRITFIVKHKRSILFSLLLVVSASASAQTLPAAPSSAPVGPLNLSLPKKAVQGAETEVVPSQSDDSAKRAAQAAAAGSSKKDDSSELRLPYGAGFENRQQGMGFGGSGRGGKGRGR
jgi:hypothetical protein